MIPEDNFLETLENWANLYFFQSLTEFFNYLKQTDLSLLQAYALAYLHFKGPVRMSELYEHMGVSPGAASQLVDRLEKLEMVERIPDPNDRRVRKIRVRKKGEQFVQENFRFSQNWLNEIPADISPQQAAQIADVLSMLMQGFGKQEQ